MWLYNNIKMRERRRFLRFKIPLKIEFSVDGFIEVTQKGETVDFSREGVRISFPSNLFSHKDTIEFKTYLPKRPVPVVFKGNMRWIRSRDNACEMGVKIEHMEPEDKGTLLDYAYKLWEKEVK